MKTNKKSKFNNLITMLIVIVCLCLMISIADLFSSIITVGGFSFISEDVSIPKYEVYAVCVSNHLTQVQAQENANICISLGGAGYIYTEDKYYVIASIYENENDAIKVKESLIVTKPTTIVLKITIPSISVANTLNAQEKNTLNETFLIFKTTFKKLYDISISLDTNVIQEISAKLNINEIASDINETINNFNTLFNSNSYNHYGTINESLNKLLTCVNNLVSTSKIPYTSYIKYTYCDSLFIYQNLAQSLV